MVENTGRPEDEDINHDGTTDSTSVARLLPNPTMALDGTVIPGGTVVAVTREYNERGQIDAYTVQVTPPHGEGRQREIRNYNVQEWQNTQASSARQMMRNAFTTEPGIGGWLKDFGVEFTVAEASSLAADVWSHNDHTPHAGPLAPPATPSTTSPSAPNSNPHTRHPGSGQTP